MASTRKLLVEIAGDERSLNKALRGAQDSTSKFGKTFGKAAKGVGIAAVGIGGAIAFGLKKSIDSANEHAQALAQTQAVIKSTGGAAGVTSKQILGLADSIEKKTGMDDLAIQSGENLLATFTNIKNETGKGNDIFTQTTKVMADMSQALGQDTKSSAIQLGKALNDPVKGVTALQRVGVSFTKGQKDQIKSLVDSGKTMDAQKLILRELNKEFGGSAEAAGKTLPGQLNILRARLDDVAQRIGEKLVPALSAIVDWVTKHWPQISAVIEKAFDGIAAAWVALQPTFKKIVAAVRQVVEYVREHWPEISRVIGRVVEDIRIIWEKIGPTLTAVFKNAAKAIIPLVRSIAQIVKGVALIIDGIIHGKWAQVWEGFKDVAIGAVKGLKTLLVTAFKDLGILLAALVVAPINFIIDKINKIKLPAIKINTHIPGVGTITSPSIDPIPHIGRITLGATHVSNQIKVEIDGRAVNNRHVKVKPIAMTSGLSPGVQ